MNQTLPHVLQWKNLTGAEFAELDKSKIVVVVTCSPLEVHGPHLPLITDILEGESLLNRAMELLHPQHPEIVYLKLPFLYTATDVVPQYGSINFRCSTIIRVLEDLGRSLACHGFRHIWVSNFHGGPRHFVSMEVACDRVSRRHKIRMISLFSLLINQLTGGANDLTEVLGSLPGIKRKYLEEDMHAGFIETSMMLYLLQEFVDKNYHTLAKSTINTQLATQGKKPVFEQDRSLTQLYRRFKYALKYYETKSYCGDPAAATVEFGRQILDVLAGLTATALGQLWREELSLADCHTPLWPVRAIFLNPLLGWCFEKWIGYKSQVW